MKKFLALALSFMMVRSLAACGGTTEPEPQENTDPAESQTESGAPAESSDPAAAAGDVDAVIAQYNLDLESDEWQDVTGEPLPLSQDEAKALFSQLEASSPTGKMTYQEVVDLMGAEPTAFNGTINPGQYTFRWMTEDSYQVRVTFKNDFPEHEGEWLVNAFSWS